jgi:hypothetical protein
MTNKNHQYIPLIKAYADQMENNRKLTTALETHLCHGSYASVADWPMMDGVYQYLCDCLCEKRRDIFFKIMHDWFDRTASESGLLEIWYRISKSGWRHTVNKKIDPTKAKGYKRYDTYEEVMDLYYPS